MRFANPNYIFLIFIIIFLIVFFVWAMRKRKKVLERFAQKDLLKELLNNVDIKKKNIRFLFFNLAIIFCIFSLMRPQWGFQWKEIKKKGLDIMVALDTSKSMLANDVKPNRLERSKLALKDLVGKLKGDRIGLIAFSGTAFFQCPLTIDYNGFMLTLEDLNIETISRGGTSISSAISEALKSYAGGINKYKVLIIITDGEDHEGQPLNLAEDAKKEGIVIHCIGIGTQEGELISVKKEDGSSEYVKDLNGNVVKSRLDEDLLKKIALTTGGTYIRSTSIEFGLETLYNEKLSKMEKREFEGKMAKQFEERFQIPLIIGLMFLLLEIFINDAKK